MKSDSFRNNRKALAALLLCSSFITGCPLAVMAESNRSILEVVQLQIKVSGVVKDAMGEPVIGASIQEKGTSNGIITDINGNFSLSVNQGATLVISYIGFETQEIPVVAGKILNVILKEDTEVLDEVVVIGFGTQKKVNLTGSVGIATGKELESRPVSSATQALQGLVPGLKITTDSGQLEATMGISVRGTGTIGEGSKSSPLILIDGMEGDINTVNPQDIENISVLKDAAASSIYGSRAPFGVILITTKKGQQGKVSINYNNSFRVSSPINMPKAMDSYSFAVMMNYADANRGIQGSYSDETMRKMIDFQNGKFTNGEVGLDAKSETAWEDRWTQGYANTDIWDAMYKDHVFSQEHNISVTGGSEKMSYYTSFNYLDQGGLLNFGEENLQRFNTTAKISGTLTKWLRFNLSTRFTRNDICRPTSLTDSFFENLGRTNWPNMPIYDQNGHINHDYPRKLAEGGQRTQQTDRHYYQAAFIIEPVKNWITNVEFNYSIKDESTKAATLPAYNYDPQGNKIVTNTDTSLKENDQKEDYLNLNIYSSYAYTFADKHNFKLMGGFQTEKFKLHYFDVTKYGLLMEDEDFWEFDLTSGLSAKNEAKTTDVNGYSREWVTAGFFGRLNYDFLGRYLLEVNMRYDGSSRFRRGSRWQLSPSFSVGWNIAQEKFFAPAATVVDQLKLRFSYGQLGNQNTDSYYPTYRVISLGASNGSWIQNGRQPNTATVGNLINEALTWETVRTWNVGLDWGLLNNRLTGSADYFIRYTKDMVGPGNQMPNTLGIDVPDTNNCDLQTRGWELSFSWKDRLNNGLNYGITLSLSDQITYIDSYPGNKTGSISTYMTGKKIGLIWGFETIGIAKTQEEMDTHLATLPNGGQDAIGTQWAAGDIMYKDLNGDGKISKGASTWDDHGDLKILGDNSSHYFFGVDLTASYKGFDFRCFLQGVLKHDFWPGESSYFWGVRGGYSKWYTLGLEQHNDYFRDQPLGLEGYELPVNLDSYYPRPITSPDSGGSSFGAKNQEKQSRYMQNARYMRLKNLQLGYSLPKSVIGKLGISNCRIFVSGENLLTFTPLSSIFDPETCTGGWGGNSYPLSSTWSFGLNVTF